nr:DUF4306 domain-containing protein [uncultured Bacillus sp.]
MFRFIFQFGAASVVFLFSTLAAWYEGSSLLDQPSEWKSSTPVTQWLSGPVHDESDILQWDFLIFAAKFKPTFPMIMTVSAVYLFLFLGFHLFKRVKKWYAYYLFLLSTGLFLSSYYSYDYSVPGGYKMFVLFASCGSFCLILGLITYLTVSIKVKRTSTEKQEKWETIQ